MQRQKWMRRSFLQAAGALAACSSPGVAVGARSVRRDGLAGIDPRDVVDAYRKRRLDRLEDRELARQVGEIVSVPCEGLTSFTLHAPLELLARQGLLPFVDAADRERARIQMVASAAIYADGTRPEEFERVEPAGTDPRSARTALVAALDRGDAAATEAHALALAARFGPRALVETLAPTCLASMHAAAHSHIGLWLVIGHGAAGADRPGLLRAAIRHVAARPSENLTSFDGLAAPGDGVLTLTPDEVESRIERILASPVRGEYARAIRPALRTTQEEGMPERLFGELFRHEWVRPQMAAAFRAILRTSARSMLRDDIGVAKNGWSHALTQPQAACGLALAGVAPRRALATGFVYAAANRCNSGRVELEPDWTPEPTDATLDEALLDTPATAAAHAWHAVESSRDSLRRRLATEASLRNDQHLVKYVRACLDAIVLDPSAAHLFDAAAAYLCAVWMQEVLPGTELDDLRAGRATPR